MEIYHIPYVIFQTTSPFFFKYCITLQCHERYLLRTFLLQTLKTPHKRNQRKKTFSEFSVLRLKFTKFLSFLKQQISFSLNFASLLCVVRHNSSFISQLKFYVLSTKGACQNTNLVNFYFSSRMSKTLHFDGLLLFKSYKVSAKKVQKLSLITLQSDAKFKKN